MTAATGELTYEDGLIAHAQDTLDRTKDARWPGPETRETAEAAAGVLTRALKQYRDLCNGIVPPWFPGMAPGPASFARVTRCAAEDAWESAELLDELLATCTEDETARVLPAAAEGEVR